MSSAVSAARPGHCPLPLFCTSFIARSLNAAILTLILAPLAVAAERADFQAGQVYVDDDFAGAAPGDTVTFVFPDGGKVEAVFGLNAFAGIADSVNAAPDGGTVFVASGDYATGRILIDRNLSMTGIGADKPVIGADGDITGGLPRQAWFLVETGTDFTVENVVFDGGDHRVHYALRSHGNTTIDEVDFRNIKASLSGDPYFGLAVASFGGDVAGGGGRGGYRAAHLTVTGSTFAQIGRIGILVKGTESTAEILGNVFIGKGEGDFLDYSVEIGAGASAEIFGNTISGNRGIAATDDSRSAGIIVTSFFGGESSATVEGNIITDSLIGVFVGFGEDDANDVVIAKNEFGNNRYQLDMSYNGTDLVTDVLAGNIFDRAVVVRENRIVVPTIFGHIQDAVDASSAGQTIDVQTGVYRESGVVNMPAILRTGALAGVPPGVIFQDRFE